MSVEVCVTLQVCMEPEHLDGVGIPRQEIYYLFDNCHKST